ncbi:MAG: DNA-3-methyladenine glycosylase I [Rhodospirillaceae bacterium]|nr:DNA-3-methyladenine glycosylase I [Rhodospirillaceae bacterium]|tara:strand:+ start:3172 stop:3852 length:681 start_codon:yes stop_codon:yes gene_type:complete
MRETIQNSNETIRCSWCTGDTVYERYHDTEWGVPSRDDQTLFQKICLEGFQAGLSWLTILKKRDNFRECFDNFDFEIVSKYDQTDVSNLLKNVGIIRHRGKIVSAINNANRAIDLRKEAGSLAAFFWHFEPKQSRKKEAERAKLPVAAFTCESVALSNELKKRGWSFIGPTICYSFMQSLGIVNDHAIGCFRREEIERLRQKFVRPVLSGRTVGLIDQIRQQNAGD